MNHLINVCFHGVGRPARALELGEEAYWVTEDLFEESVAYLAEQPRIKLSFDDGNASDVHVALPVLLRHGLRASFFPLAGRLEEAGSLGAADLRALAEAGMTIGSHGRDHRPWRGLTAAQAEIEFESARDDIEQAAGVDVLEAACPLGVYDRRTLSRLKSLGYRKVFTSDRTRAAVGSWLQPRYSLRAGDDLGVLEGWVESQHALLPGLLGQSRIAVKRWLL